MKCAEGRKYVGAAGTMTELICTLEPGDEKAWAVTLATYFFDCPGQSVAWRHYHLAIVHLRPIEGVRPAHIDREGATHEVMLFALDPRSNPVVSDPNTWHFLRPYNFIGQMTLPDDEKAKETCLILARAVADGFLWAEPPLSGQREPWQSQLRQLEEHALGKHYQ